MRAVLEGLPFGLSEKLYRIVRCFDADFTQEEAYGQSEKIAAL